ncbi:MAG: protein phosphatase 2C domain-containing protein [Acidobacteriota bacterium]|nr:protein phosphatase 2C domain-containing protein [Acidobacteriota bacterium]
MNSHSLESFALSDKGKVRANNEDYCRVVPELGLYLLADGMGGAKGGAHASRLAVETVVDFISGSATRDAATLKKAVEEANRRVLEESSRDPKLDGMGTTLVAGLEIGSSADPEIALVSVGDSRAYLLDDDDLKAVTEDQTWVRDVGKPLGLDEQTLKNHPMRHVLTMAIGVGSVVATRSYTVQLKPSMLLLLSSDGLHGVVACRDIEKILRESIPGDSTLEHKCERLIHAARQAGGPDNISAVLLRPRSS